MGKKSSAAWFFSAFVTLCVLCATVEWGVRVAIGYLIVQIVLSLLVGFSES